MSTFLPTNSARPRDHLKSNCPEGDVAAFQITRKGKASYDRMCFISPMFSVCWDSSIPHLRQPMDCGGAAGELGGGKQTKHHSEQPFCSLAPRLAGASGGSRAAHKGLGPARVVVFLRPPAPILAPSANHEGTPVNIFTPLTMASQRSFTANLFYIFMISKTDLLGLHLIKPQTWPPHVTFKLMSQIAGPHW